MVKGGPCLWWMKGAGQVLKADFIEGQSEDKAVLLFSSHPPPSARYPGETRAETVAGLSAFRELLSSKLKVSADLQCDLPAWLGLLGRSQHRITQIPTCQEPQPGGSAAQGMHQMCEPGGNVFPLLWAG